MSETIRTHIMKTELLSVPRKLQGANSLMSATQNLLGALQSCWPRGQGPEGLGKRLAMKCKHREFLKVPKEFECAAEIESRYLRASRKVGTEAAFKAPVASRAAKKGKADCFRGRKGKERTILLQTPVCLLHLHKFHDFQMSLYVSLAPQYAPLCRRVKYKYIRKEMVWFLRSVVYNKSKIDVTGQNFLWGGQNVKDWG